LDFPNILLATHRRVWVGGRFCRERDESLLAIMSDLRRRCKTRDPKNRLKRLMLSAESPTPPGNRAILATSDRFPRVPLGYGVLALKTRSWNIANALLRDR